MSIPDKLLHLDTDIQQTLANEARQFLDDSTTSLDKADLLREFPISEVLLVKSAVQLKMAEKINFFVGKREKRVKKSSKIS